MKFLLLFIIFAAASSSFLPKKSLDSPSPYRQNLIDFIIGNLVALKIMEDAPESLNCVMSIEILQSAIQQALSLLREWHLTEAFSLFKNAFNETHAICGLVIYKGNISDITLHTFLAKIRDPKFIKLALGRIADNILKIENGFNDIQNQSSFNADYDFGSIINLMISGPDPNLINFLIEEIDRLGAIQWKFNTCSSASLIELDSVTLDIAPAKGSTEGFNFLGKVNDGPVMLKQVQIVIYINGNNMNTLFDTFNHHFQKGDPLMYRYVFDIPPFFPMGSYSMMFSFQAQDGTTAGCLNVNFDL